MRIDPSCRDHKTGRLISGNWINGYEHPPEHRAKVRAAAIRRGLTGYRYIRVAGVTYPNMTIAAEKTGISTRSLRRYALSDAEKHRDVFFVN